MFNVQPISSQADIEEFGENARQMQKAVISKKYLNEFKEFDVAYLDGNTPLENGGEIKAKINEINSERVSVVDRLKVCNLVSGEIECYQCLNANYKLYPPRNQNKVIVIYFKRLTAK